MRRNSRAFQLAAAACLTALILAACRGDEEADDETSSTEAAAAAGSQSSEMTDMGAAGDDTATTADSSAVGGEETDADEERDASIGTESGAVDDAVGAELLGVFVGYRQALVDRDGEAAVLFVSPSTIEWYDVLLDLGLRADADVLETQAPLADAMSVVPLRARFGNELTTIADGRDLFVRGIDAGLTGDDLASVRFDAFASAEDGTAMGLVGGKPLFVFVRGDNGAWALDLEATTTAIFTQLPEDVFVNGLTGGQGTSRRDLFELVARNVYATTWEELSEPVAQ